MIVDAHNDLLLERAYRSHRLGEPDPLRKHWLAQLAALAGRGGVLGVMLHPLALGAGATIEQAVDHAVATMGTANVGLEGDFTRQVVRALGYEGSADALLPDGMPLDAALDCLVEPGDYPNLAAALRGRGYEGDRLAAILGGNFLRLFRAVLPGAVLR